VVTGGLSDLVNPGVPPAAPQFNVPSFSPAEQQFAMNTGFTPVQEAIAPVTNDFESPMGIFSEPLQGGQRNNKNLPWIIGGAVAVVLVIVLIMRK
jgi:hypothetical protein